MAPEPLKLSSISLDWPGKNSSLHEAVTASVCKALAMRRRPDVAAVFASYADLQ